MRANLFDSNYSNETEPSVAQFQQLFKQYYPNVVRKIITIVHDQQTAEEIAQEVFLKLYHSDMGDIESIPAWLMKVAVRLSYNYIRTEKRQKKKAEKQAEYSHDLMASVEESYMKKEHRQEVKDALAQLNERDQLLLMMKFSGFKYGEISQTANVERTSVGTLIARAKKRFKNVYSKMKGDDLDGMY
ncbi:RNA polymerase sigma factor SigX [Pontibacillus chungwhensis]|uniref:RNA polymerase sigma factor SigX n=1 Tax=Pontibacillus chungwhensis TaxID=265426 RepID=UPI001E404CD4|nr:RNA polymerase sigma factor SigX [Pontibacillus chungwhensis]